MSLKLLLALAALPLCTQAPPPAPAQAEAILLQIILDNAPLGDGLTAFPGAKGGTLVPLGELCRLLALGIHIEAGGQTASGFFISEKRRFKLDLRRALVEVEGRILPLAPSETLAMGGEIFVDAGLLELWFPMKAKVDTKTSSLTLEPKEKLPVQLAWEEDRVMKGLASASTGVAPKLPMVDVPYSALDWPMVDLNTAWNTAQHQPTLAPQGSLSLSGDALWMSGQTVFTRDALARNHLARTTLFREDPDGELLGPLHARRLMVGDLLQTPVLDLAGAPAAGASGEQAMG